jgi:LacI family transcriptional regulator, repressor for deo operon, udp, cdd, tsx, nupC, and nupG
MATIKEVAAAARVTPTTVTNVLRGRGRTSEATRQRVLAAVAKKGYRPNLTARALAERKAPTLALMLPCITNPFYPEFTLQAHLAARRRDRFLLVCSTDHEVDGGEEFLDQVAGSLSDGVLVANRPGLDLEQLERVEARGTPVVVTVWEDPERRPGVACVSWDARRAGCVATEHLLALGHRRIGAIVGSPKGGIHQGRYDGFRDALRAAHVRCPADAVRFCPDTFEGGQEAAGELLAARPELTAIFVSNDLPALGALDAAAALGRKVPTDLSVVSITNIPQAAQSRPALTTVAIPTIDLAVRGIELLLEIQEHRPPSPPMIRIPGLELIVRASTDKPPVI